MQHNSVILGIVFLFSSLFIGLFLNIRREKLLSNSQTTIGYLVEEYNGGKNPRGTFIFRIGKKKYIFDYIGDFSYMNKGDTVLIKYSIEDPSVARVIDRYYMQKYKHLKGN